MPSYQFTMIPLTAQVRSFEYSGPAISHEGNIGLLFLAPSLITAHVWRPICGLLLGAALLRLCGPVCFQHGPPAPRRVSSWSLPSLKLSWSLPLAWPCCLFTVIIKAFAMAVGPGEVLPVGSGPDDSIVTSRASTLLTDLGGGFAWLSLHDTIGTPRSC